MTEICKNCGHELRHHGIDGKGGICMIEKQTDTQGCKKFEPQNHSPLKFQKDTPERLTSREGSNPSSGTHSHKGVHTCDGRCLTEDRLKKKHQNQASNVVDRATNKAMGKL